MFRSIAKGFKALDNFLTDSELYVEQRVWNGKFIYDLKFISDSNIANTKRTLHKLKDAITASNIYNSSLASIHKFLNLLMQIQLIEDVVLLVRDGLRLHIKYFAHYLLVLIVGLLSTSALLMTFKSTPLVFLVMFIPLLYANHILLTSFYMFVTKKEDDTQFSLSDFLTQSKLTLPTNSLLFFLQISLFVIVAILIVAFAFGLSVLFSSISIDWSSSFLYWLPVVMFGLLLLVFLTLAEIVLLFSYPLVLLDKKNSLQAITNSLRLLHLDPRDSFLFYILLTFFSICFIGIVSTNNYEGGFAVSTLFTSYAFLLLGFLLKKKYFKNIPDPITFPFEKIHIFIKPSVGFGIISYILLAGLMLQLHTDILLFLDDQRPTIVAKYEFSKYTNTEAGYTIDYPKPWSVYRWDKASATVYTNVTGTETGGIKVNINVTPIEKSTYLMLRDANPGLIQYDTGTGNVITKIANMTVRNRNAVKFTYTRTDTTQTEYETHYMISAGSNVYDIAFVTVSKKIEASYVDIFDKMVESFELIPQE